MTIRLISLLLLLLSFPALAGDVYVKTKNHTDAVSMKGMTTPAKDEITEQWIGAKHLAHVGANRSVVVDLDKKQIFFINPQSKTYVQATLPFEMTKLLPPQMASMVGMMKMSMKVNPTPEKKMIGKWNCQGYDITMTVMGMPIKTKAWVTKDVPIDMAQYRALYAQVLKGQFLDEASIQEINKIDGFQVASETNGEIMGAKIRSTTEILEIATKDAPAGVYAPPAGFTKKDALEVEDLQQK